MNALALWIPGTLLVVVGAVLLALGQVGFGAAIAIIAVGVAVESAGVLLWVKQRRAAGRR
jgi:membrane protein DedA with SNARE-associated domain